MTIRIEAVKENLRAIQPLLRERYKVESIGVFGSYVRNQQREDSDLDLLVEFYEIIDLFTLVELRDFLSTHLGVKVDLALRSALKPHIRDNILDEVVYV